MSGHLVAADSTSEEQFWRGSIANLITLTLTLVIGENTHQQNTSIATARKEQMPNITETLIVPRMTTFDSHC